MWEANEQNMISVLTVYRSEWNCKERLYPNRITGRVSDSPEGKGKMSQTVLITGTGRPYALGFNLVRRYLENGDRVFASVRRPSEALEGLKKEFPDKLHILTMDIAATASVNAAARETEALTDHLDLIINNATTASADTMKELPDFDLDLIAPAVNVGAVGPIRVVKAFLPLLQKSPAGALVVNISSEAGSIGKCYRTFYLDYGTEKAALNMLTMTLHNYFKEDPNLNILCVHPGWIRTNPDNREAPLDPYEHAETLRCLFEKKRHDKDGPVFITYEGEAYPW
jgi:NAD(P)-dependent dehydrogenase (short-subunit alcohol dehydrogenase family)